MKLMTSMIVEDNPLNWMIMKNQLLKHGLTPEILNDGLSALEYCQNHPLPNLILLDGYMPRMDGITFLKALRAMRGGERPYVLFCSSSPDKIDANEALLQGADCHFPKPIAEEQLLFALEGARARMHSFSAYKQA